MTTKTKALIAATVAVNILCITFISLINYNSKILREHYTCPGGVCSLGIFTSHLNHVADYVYKSSIASLSLYSFILLVYLSLKAVVISFLEWVQTNMWGQMLVKLLYVGNLCLSMLISGAVFSTDIWTHTGTDTQKLTNINQLKWFSILHTIFAAANFFLETA